MHSYTSTKIMCDSTKIRLISRRTKFFCSVIISVILVNMVDLSQAQIIVELTKVVVSNKVGKGVESNVVRQFPNGSQVYINDTDKNGTLILVPPKELNRSDKVCVVAGPDYRVPGCQEVQEQMSFTVNARNREAYNIYEIGNLIAIASMSDLTINAGEKVLVSSEIARRVQKLDSEFANEARYFAYWSAGEALGIDDAVTYDFKQKSYVPSSHLKESITLFQRSNNIKDNGLLDEPTMSLMAGGQPLWMYLYDTSPAWEIIKSIPSTTLENEHWTKFGYKPSNSLRIQPTIPNDLITALASYDNVKLVNLGLHATEAKQEGKFALAAMLNNELTTRLRQLNTPYANSIALGTEIETYKALGMVLDLSSSPISFDVLQNKYVMSHALSDELRLFQIQNGVTVTGDSDYRTLRALANDNVGQYLISPW